MYTKLVIPESPASVCLVLVTTLAYMDKNNGKICNK